MRTLSSIKKRALILVAVAAISVGASACFADTQAGPPIDPFRAQVWSAMNADRARNGLPPLTQSPKLEWLAQGQAQYLAEHVGSLVHRDLAWTLYNDPEFANYYTLGENLLVGPWYMNAGQMETSWMNSPPHRANILSPNYNVVGIGWFGLDGRIWVVVDFGAI